MTIQQFLRILRARWVLAASIFAVIVLGTLGVSLMMPKSYTASVNIMADIRPDPIAPMSALAAGTAATYLETQADIIESAAVAERVVRMLNLTENPEMRERWMAATGGQGDYVTWLGELIGRGLEVKPSRESSIIQVKYESATPAFASSMANAFAKAYIDTTVRIKADPAQKYTAFFEERAQQARDKLEKARTKLVEAQRAKDIVMTEERLDVEMMRLSELSSQVTALKGLRSETSSRSNEADRNADQLRDVLNNSVVSTLKTEIARSEARLRELNERFGDAHPLVIESKANIETLRDRMRAETGRVGRSARVDNSMAEARVATAEKQLEEQRQRVLKMKDARAELQVLERDVELAQHIYDSIQERLNQSAMESKTNQSTLYILSPATEPSHPTSPRVFLNTGVAVGLGGLIAIIAALTAELLDRRVRTPVDIVQVLEIPVIGVLPVPKSKSRLRKLLSSNKPVYLPVASLPAQQ